MNIFDKAIVFAQKAHEGQTRKRSNVPYITHPMEVASIAASMTDNLEVLAGAILHDTVEDTNTTLEDIKNEFGERVAYLVASETEDKRAELPPEDTWLIRKKESLELLENTNDKDIKIIWLSDKLSNLRSFYRSYLAEGELFWYNFHQTDPKMQEWYYRKIAECLIELKDTVAYKEYLELLDKIFGGKANEFN